LAEDKERSSLRKVLTPTPANHISHSYQQVTHESEEEHAEEEEQVASKPKNKQMHLIKDIDPSKLKVREITETETMSYLTKIAGIPRRNQKLGKMKSQQLEEYN
jgi:hypothetical protein